MRLSAPVYQLKRRARLLARNETITLAEALDRVARDEGFATWSLLASRLAADPPEKPMLSQLSDGDLLLLGGRPGHGKTLAGLQLLIDAAREGRRAVFFTLEYSDRETRARIGSLEAGGGGVGDRLEIVAADDICADTIVQHLAGSPAGTVAVVDYLQILDQQRQKPALSDQIRTLAGFSRESGAILAFIAQIDRSFDPERSPMPGIGDIRLPNAVDLGSFSKACFLHGGAVRWQAIA
ncbi:DNA helicase [Aurantimonas aggregata]|uniref:DNA helicase n=1 Tax=Aurantimonas aggregata TaxID=2047720 RepID=A0A6L9MIQ9_9HYPH|nr:DNA helicase [Aurantimonas aggregata]NDV87713.1 DNA helicase [Aurantimonas aggregata]